MKTGTVINIKPSEALSLMRLNMLIGKEAMVIQDLTGIGRLNKGYMVELTEPYLEEDDWLIPKEYIDD